jgi:guanylate kinase
MIICLSGPSGIGKGFIQERLLQAYPFIKELVWLTTRTLRPNEEKRNRISVSESEFDNFTKTGELVLVQNIFGHRYGLRKEDLLPSSRACLTEIHPDNLKVALEINPEIISIGLITFDLPLLHRRLSTIRKTESAPEIEKRVATAKIEIETIIRNRLLFTAVIEVGKSSESSIISQVIAVLNPYLTGKENGNAH